MPQNHGSFGLLNFPSLRTLFKGLEDDFRNWEKQRRGINESQAVVQRYLNNILEQNFVLRIMMALPGKFLAHPV